MKFLAFIVLLMIVLAQFLKANTIQMSEPEILEFKPNAYTVYVSCIDGYKYMFYRETVVQMTQKNGEFGSSRATSVPVSCK